LNPKSRNVITNIFKYNSEINDSKNVCYKHYNKKNTQGGNENIAKDDKEDKLKEKILKNFSLNCYNNSSPKNNINSTKTRNKQKNLQLYLTYSNKNEIQNEKLKDSNIIKNNFYNINTVKINLNKPQSENEKINIYMSNEMGKTAKRNPESEIGIKAFKFTQSQFKKM